MSPPVSSVRSSLIEFSWAVVPQSVASRTGSWGATPERSHDFAADFARAMRAARVSA